MESDNYSLIFSYMDLFADMRQILEIEHLDSEYFSFIQSSVPESGFIDIVVFENRMAICYDIIGPLYNSCKDIVLKSQHFTDEEFIDKFELLNLATKEMLCINGEVNAAVNRRLRMLKLNLLKDLEEELNFISVVTLKFKKSGILWFYRRKVLTKYMKEKGITKENVEKMLEKENEVVDRFLGKYARNYYGWDYKQFLIYEFIVKQGYNDLLWTEYLKLKEYCGRNVHEYCAFHLFLCLNLKLRETGKYPDLKKQEIEWGIDLLKKYSEMYAMEAEQPLGLGVKYHELESVKKFINTLEKS